VEEIERMKNKPSFLVLALAVFAVITMVAYLIFALTLADHMQSDPVPANPAETTKPAM
jgi:hypothetical protein